MKTNNIIKKLLPGLLPLLIFIIADEFFDTTISIIIAIAVGIVQAIWIFIKERRFDYFVLLDTGLMVLLGSVSLIFHNDTFFKIKPGIIEIILCIMLFFMAFAPNTMLKSMIGKYSITDDFTEQHLSKFRHSLKILAVVFLFHTILVFYSAFYMSKEAWAFISGVLFYLIFAAYTIFEIVKKIIVLKTTEWLPIVDEEGKITGKVIRSEAHKNKMYLHPVVHIHIVNKKGELYLQKRAANKLVMPGKWDTAVGGHIAWGETIEQAIQRETKEELGIELHQVKFLGKYVWESDIERELVYVFISQWNAPIFINPKEVEEGRFWSKKEIKHGKGKGIFTPNFEYEFKQIERFVG